MDLSYDEIRRIHRIEKNTSKLVEVEADFYNQLADFIASEKKAYLDSLKDFSVGKARSFTNMKKMVEEIFSMREKKILGLALIASRTNETNDARMAVQEKEVYKNVLKMLNSHNTLLSQFFSENDVPRKTPKKELKEVPVTIVQDIPSFVGGDMKEYGPFKKDEVVKLPNKIASLLVKRNFGKIGDLKSL